jgi:beta-glucuronidase
VGFREIRAEGRRILLNGEDVFLRGVCVHEDDWVHGRVVTDADLRRRFAHAKELGCNFLRLVHYPHHERVAALADELGFMLWAEVPVCWAIDFANPRTLADADNQLRELILRDRNRASVVVWGVGNENPDTDERLAFMAGLVATARALDPTRLVSAACLVDRSTRRIDDRLAAELDVVGINQYYGWYEPDMEDLAAIGRNYDGQRPIVITEAGAGAPIGRHGTAEDLFTEEHMAAVYLAQIATIAGIDAVRGLCPWVLYDFRSTRYQNSFQRGFNRMGLIDADKRTRKLAFGVLQHFYQGQQEAAPD